METSGTSTHSMDIKYVTDEKTESYTRLVDWNRVKVFANLNLPVRSTLVYITETGTW